MSRANRGRSGARLCLDALEPRTLLTGGPIDVQFAQALSGSGQIAEVTSAIDDDGNRYLAGVFEGTIDFDSGPGVEERTSQSTTRDGFVARYREDGTFDWVRTIPVSEGEQFLLTGLAVGPDGQVVTIGSASSGIDLDLDPGQELAAPETGGFVLRLDSLGEFVSVARFTVSSENAFDNIPGFVTVTPNGATFVSGRVVDGSSDLDPGPGESVLTGTNDAYLVKLTPEGGFDFARSLISQSGSVVIVTSLAVAPGDQGDLYLSGSFRGDVDFDPGAGTETRSSASSLLSDSFLLRLDDDGGFRAVATVGGTNFDQWNRVALITSGNSVTGVVTIGPFSDGVSLGGTVPDIPGKGGLDLIVARWTAQLEPVWSRLIGNEVDNVPTGVEVDSKGHIYFGGEFQGSLDLDPGPDEHIVTALGERDGYVVILDGDGNFVRGEQLGGDGAETVRQVLVEPSGYLQILGSYEGEFSIDGSNLPPTEEGQTNVFLASISFDGARPTIDQVGPVDPAVRKTPVGSVDVIFTEPIDPNSFSIDDVTLTRNGTAVSIVSANVSPVQGDLAHYRISGLQAATTPPGDYVLTVDASGVSNEAGILGLGSESTEFTVLEDDEEPNNPGDPGGPGDPGDPNNPGEPGGPGDPGNGGDGPPKLTGDYDGDGVADLALYRYDQASRTGVFSLRLSNEGNPIEQQINVGDVDSNVIPVAGDFDGDGKTDVAVVNPTARLNGSEAPNASLWIILLSGSNNFRREVPFGAAGVLDRPAPADFDGDGVTDIATFRASSDLTPGAAEWFILPSRPNPGFETLNGAFNVVFGAAGGSDLPAPFDFDGDGRAEIATFRPVPTSEDEQRDLFGVAQWFILPSSSNDGTFSERLGGFPVVFGAGGNADQPVVADFDNDGRDDIAAFRSVTDLPNNLRWFILPTAPNQPNYQTTNGGRAVSFGEDGVIAAISDYNGDGRPDLAIFDPSNNSWTIRDGVDGEALSVTFNPLGPGAVPVLSPLFFRLDATGNLPAADPPATVASAALRSSLGLIHLASAEPTASGPIDPTTVPRSRVIDEALEQLLVEDIEGDV